MTLGVVVNGALFQRAKAITVSRSLRSFAGWFEVVASADGSERLPIKLNDRIQVVSGATGGLLTGFVESLRVRQDAGSHDITVSGRDITADLVDSSLRTKEFNGPIGFEDLVGNVLRAQDLISIGVVNEAGPLGDIKESELISGEIGESAFGFLEKYARRVQAILTTNEDGNVLIMRAGAIDSGVQLIRQAGNPATNILASSVEINVTDRYRDYVCQSQISTAGPNVDATVQEATAQSGSAQDRGARSGRFLEMEAETPMDSDACGDRAKLEANVRRAQSLDYRATVQGVPTDLRLNRLVRVRDQICGIDDRLLISEIEHRFDMSGTTTSIGGTFRDAFTLQEELELATAARSSAGDDFVQADPPSLNLDEL